MANPILRDFYVYVILRPTGVPCYVGKGRGPRCNRQDRRTHNAHLAAIVRNAKAIGIPLPVIKVREWLTEEEAFRIESELIKQIGR